MGHLSPYHISQVHYILDKYIRTNITTALAAAVDVAAATPTATTTIITIITILNTLIYFIGMLLNPVCFF